MKRSKAFTLIELLISVAMISAISMAIFYFALSSIKIVSRSSDFARSTQSIRSVAVRISSDIMQSSGAGAGSGPGKLVIGNITYEFVNSKVRREEGSDVYYLTVEGEIKGLQFSYPSTKLIKIELTPKTGGIYHLSTYARN